MPELRFIEESHSYLDGDRRLASVTEIMAAVGLSKDLSFLQLDDSYRHKGSAVHAACRLVDEGRLNLEATHPDILPYAQAYASFKRDTGFVGRAWEVPLAHRALGIAGTLDVLGEARGEIWLIDFKTGTIPPCVMVQLAGYEFLLRNGEIIGNHDQAEQQWIADNLPPFLHRKSLNIVGTKYKLSNHDEARAATIFRAAVTVYNARKEYGLLRGN